MATVLQDPIVESMMREFRAVLQELVERTPHQGDALRIEAVRQLCELSRDARLHLGPLDFADAGQARDVADCFEEAAKSILDVWSGAAVPPDVEQYCKNIRERAARCRIE